MTFLPVQPPSFTLFERSGRAVFQLHMPGLQPLAYISFTSVTSFVNYDLNLCLQRNSWGQPITMDPFQLIGLGGQAGLGCLFLIRWVS